MTRILLTGGEQGEDKFLLSPHHTILSSPDTLHTVDRDYLIISSLSAHPSNLSAYDIWQGHYSRSWIKELLHNFGIKSPKFYMSRSSLATWVYPVFNKHKRLAIKSDHGARGIRKASMNLDQYLKMLDIIRKQVSTFEEDGETLTPETKQFFRVLNIKNFGDYRDATEKYGLFEDFYSNNFHVEELIDLHREFRIHYVRDVNVKDYTGYERIGYSLNYDPKKVKDVMCEPYDHIPKDLLLKIKALGDSTKSITLSFDVYQDKNGEWGVIEFASNYALESCRAPLVTKLAEQINTAIDNMYKAKFCMVREHISMSEIEDFINEAEQVELDPITKNDNPGISFIKEIAGKGYTELNNQIEQDVDLELFAHKDSNGVIVTTIKSNSDKAWLDELKEAYPKNNTGEDKAYVKLGDNLYVEEIGKKYSEKIDDTSPTINLDFSDGSSIGKVHGEVVELFNVLSKEHSLCTLEQQVNTIVASINSKLGLKSTCVLGIDNSINLNDYMFENKETYYNLYKGLSYLATIYSLYEVTMRITITKVLSSAMRFTLTIVNNETKINKRLEAIFSAEYINTFKGVTTVGHEVDHFTSVMLCVTNKSISDFAIYSGNETLKPMVGFDFKLDICPINGMVALEDSIDTFNHKTIESVGGGEISPEVKESFEKVRDNYKSLDPVISSPRVIRLGIEDHSNKATTEETNQGDQPSGAYEVLSIKDGLVTIETREPIPNGPIFSFGNDLKGMWAIDKIVVLGKTDNIKVGSCVINTGDILTEPLENVKHNNGDIVGDVELLFISPLLKEDDILIIPTNLGIRDCIVIGYNQIKINNKEYYFRLPKLFIDHVQLNPEASFNLDIYTHWIDSKSYTFLGMSLNSHSLETISVDFNYATHGCYFVNDDMQGSDGFWVVPIQLYKDDKVKDWYIPNTSHLIESDWLTSSPKEVLDKFILPIKEKNKDKQNILVNAIVNAMYNNVETMFTAIDDSYTYHIQEYLKSYGLKPASDTVIENYIPPIEAMETLWNMVKDANSRDIWNDKGLYKCLIAMVDNLTLVSNHYNMDEDPWWRDIGRSLIG